MSNYSTESLESMRHEFVDVVSGLRRLRTGCVAAAAELRQDRAKEYLTQGVARRLGMIARTIERIFELFPPDQVAPLEPDDIHEANINLHAFVINVYGIQDNLAWVFVHENSIVIDRLKVSLFKKECQSKLPLAIQRRISELTKWHDTYAKDFRDSLAHRIPLYIPPAQYTPEQVERDNELAEKWAGLVLQGLKSEAEEVDHQRIAIGRACPYFAHSHGEGNLMRLHPQLLADGNVVRDLVQLFLQSHFRPSVEIA